MPIITIAREYGARGTTIGRLVAERLGAVFVDRWLIEEVARRAEMAPALVESQDERPVRLLDRVITSFAQVPAAGLGWEPPYPDLASDPRPRVIQFTRAAIQEVAATGNAVIVGRGGSAILQRRQDATHVFLYADATVRADTIRERELVPIEVARRRVREVDANRAAYLRQVHSLDWRSPLRYTLMLNTGALGYERAAEVILAAALHGQPSPAAASKAPAASEAPR